MKCRHCGTTMKPEDRWASGQVDCCETCYVKAGGSPLSIPAPKKPKKLDKP